MRYARHDFEAAARDWGFRELLQLAELEDPDSGFFARVGLGAPQLTFYCKVWGVTDTMRAAERAQQQQQMKGHAGRVGGSSHVGASSASSTSVGSDESTTVSRHRSVSARALYVLRSGITSLFARQHQRRSHRRSPQEEYLQGVGRSVRENRI